MTNAWAKHQQFMKQHFPKLTLTAPLFYSWPIGLRFELGGELSLEEGRLSQAVDRAAAIFEAAFAQQDSLYVVAQHYNPEDFFWSLLRMSDLPGCGVDIRRSPSLDVTPDQNAVDVVLPFTRSHLDHRALFTAIANTDFTREPRLDARVYIINTTTPLIFHMYDDRGCDVIAADRATLVPLYHRFGDWLLDYDKDRMDACFE